MTANFEFPGFGSIGAIGKCREFEQVASVFAEKSASRPSRCSVCWATAVRCAIRVAWASAIPKAALDRFDSLAQWSRIGWWYTIATNYHFKWVILWGKTWKGVFHLKLEMFKASQSERYFTQVLCAHLERPVIINWHWENPMPFSVKTGHYAWRSNAEYAFWRKFTVPTWVFFA